MRFGYPRLGPSAGARFEPRRTATTPWQRGGPGAGRDNFCLLMGPLSAEQQPLENGPFKTSRKRKKTEPLPLGKGVREAVLSG